MSRTLQLNVTFINHTSLDGSTEPWGILMVLPSESNYATVDCLQSTVIKDVRRIDFFIPSQRCLVKGQQQGVLALSHFNCAVRGGSLRSHYTTQSICSTVALRPGPAALLTISSHMMKKCEWRLLVINANVNASSHMLLA